MGLVPSFSLAGVSGGGGGDVGLCLDHRGIDDRRGARRGGGIGTGRVTGLDGRVVRAPRLVGRTLGVDQVGEPPDLALDGLDRVATQLAEVTVVTARGVPGAVEPLLEPGTATFEDAQPDV